MRHAIYVKFKTKFSNSAHKVVRWKIKKRLTFTWSVFVKFSVDTKILLTSKRLTDWRSNVRCYSILHSKLCAFSEALCMPSRINYGRPSWISMQNTTATPLHCRSGEPPIHPSISPIDRSISRELCYSWPRGQICGQCWRLACRCFA